VNHCEEENQQNLNRAGKRLHDSKR
jgi:hypothetical protein